MANRALRGPAPSLLILSLLLASLCLWAHSSHMENRGGVSPSNCRAPRDRGLSPPFDWRPPKGRPGSLPSDWKPPQRHCWVSPIRPEILKGRLCLPLQIRVPQGQGRVFHSSHQTGGCHVQDWDPSPLPWLPSTGPQCSAAGRAPPTTALLHTSQTPHRLLAGESRQGSWACCKDNAGALGEGLQGEGQRVRWAGPRPFFCQVA